MSLIIQSSVHYEVALEHMKIKLFITSLPNLIQDLGGNPFTHNEKNINHEMQRIISQLTDSCIFGLRKERPHTFFCCISL